MLFLSWRFCKNTARGLFGCGRTPRRNAVRICGSGKTVNTMIRSGSMPKWICDKLVSVQWKQIVFAFSRCMAAIQLLLFAGDLVVAGDLVRTPHGWCFFWPIGAASAFCAAVFLQAHDRSAGLAAPLWMKRVFLLAALRTLQHVPVLLPKLSLEWCFFFLTHGVTVDGVSSGPSVRRPLSASQFFSKAHNPGAGLAAPLWMKRVFFLAALRTLQHVPKLSLASLCFFLTHRTTVCRRRKIMPWAILQPSFFCMEKKIDTWGARSMDR